MSRQSRNPFRPQARVAGKTGPYASDSKLDSAQLDLNHKTDFPVPITRPQLSRL